MVGGVKESLPTDNSLLVRWQDARDERAFGNDKSPEGQAMRKILICATQMDREFYNTHGTRFHKEQPNLPDNALLRFQRNSALQAFITVRNALDYPAVHPDDELAGFLQHVATLPEDKARKGLNLFVEIAARRQHDVWFESKSPDARMNKPYVAFNELSEEAKDLDRIQVWAALWILAPKLAQLCIPQEYQDALATIHFTGNDDEVILYTKAWLKARRAA